MFTFMYPGFVIEFEVSIGTFFFPGNSISKYAFYLSTASINTLDY